MKRILSLVIISLSLLAASAVSVVGYCSSCGSNTGWRRLSPIDPSYRSTGDWGSNCIRYGISNHFRPN